MIIVDEKKNGFHLNIYMDGVMTEMKGKVWEVGAKMFAEGRKWIFNSILFADDTVLIAENESDTTFGQCF